ncbi:helix-turn-helix transcriptional regulator [Oleiagrimonas citrea]|uniref:Helix-turn-helix transcriptional regulator n=2 Tax=Oleiagrimonas citrea TaxID=1665687 RepID=A0A846ZI88_9GAMM|nr:helix-turn-helix transcriptional regulator [Oleiagrimonas citrea]
MHHAVMFEKDLVAATSRTFILSILTEGDSYGYEIIQHVAALTHDELIWTDGMLYPVLHRLEDSGCVRSYWQPSSTGRKRKYYALTDTGRAELEERKRQWHLTNDALSVLWRNP